MLKKYIPSDGQSLESKIENCRFNFCSVTARTKKITYLVPMKKFHIQSFHDKLIKFTLLFYWEIFLFLCFYFKHAAQTRNNGEFGLNDLTIASKH